MWSHHSPACVATSETSGLTCANQSPARRPDWGPPGSSSCGSVIGTDLKSSIGSGLASSTAASPFLAWFLLLISAAISLAVSSSRCPHSFFSPSLLHGRTPLFPSASKSSQVTPCLGVPSMVLILSHVSSLGCPSSRRSSGWPDSLHTSILSLPGTPSDLHRSRPCTSRASTLSTSPNLDPP